MGNTESFDRVPAARVYRNDGPFKQALISYWLKSIPHFVKHAPTSKIFFITLSPSSLIFLTINKFKLRFSSATEHESILTAFNFDEEKVIFSQKLLKTIYTAKMA